MDDFELLRQFHSGSEDAFQMLVNRHLNVVYSVALRTVRSPQFAEEIAFSVFSDLAKNAGNLKPSGPMVAWLFRVTRRTAFDVLKREERRKRRELVCSETSGIESEQPLPDELLVNLDGALEQLKAADRSVILMRFVEEQTVDQIAEFLGVSNEAAQKRIERAIERLRQDLVRRGTAMTSITLGTLLSSYATQSAPSGVASGISGAIQLSPGFSAAGQLGSITAMTTIQKTGVILLTTGLLTTSVYQHARVGNAKEELRRTSAELLTVRNDLEDAERRLETAKGEIGQLREQARDIHRLRGLLATRKAESLEPGEPPEEAEASVAEGYLRGIDVLKNAFTVAPNSAIPEMSLLTDREWLEAAIVMRESTEYGLEKAMAHLRTLAKGKYSLHLTRALQKFVAANYGMLPAEPSDLGEYLEESADRAALARYELVRSGMADQVEGAETILRERSKVAEFDSQFNISLLGAGYASPKQAGSERTYGFSFTSEDLPMP